MKKRITLFFIIFVVMSSFTSYAEKPLHRDVKQLKQKYVDILDDYKKIIETAQSINRQLYDSSSNEENLEKKNQIEGDSDDFQDDINIARKKINAFLPFVEIEYLEIEDLQIIKPTNNQMYLIFGMIEDIDNDSLVLKSENGYFQIEISIFGDININFKKSNYLICQVKKTDDNNIEIVSDGYIKILDKSEKKALYDKYSDLLEDSDKIFDKYYNSMLPKIDKLPCSEIVKNLNVKIKTINEKYFGENLCPYCGVENCKGDCITPLLESNSFSQYLIAIIVGIVLAIIIGGLIIVLNKKSRCHQCGSKLVNGVCPECTKVKCPICGAEKISGRPCPNGCKDNEQFCEICGSKLVNGVCPECTIVRCPICGAEKLYGRPCPNGCKDKTPLNLVWSEPDATRIYAKCLLRVVAPEKFAGYQLKVPKFFDMGKSANGYATAFVELNMDGHPLAEECSRQYVRFREKGEGFEIELLTESGNTLIVDDVSVSQKGQILVAKVGSVVKLHPDWEIQIVK